MWTSHKIIMLVCKHIFIYLYAFISIFQYAYCCTFCFFRKDFGLGFCFNLIEIPKNLSKTVFAFYLFYLWIVYKYMCDTLLSKVCLISVFLS